MRRLSGRLCHCRRQETDRQLVTRTIRALPKLILGLVVGLDPVSLSKLMFDTATILMVRRPSIIQLKDRIVWKHAATQVSRLDIRTSVSRQCKQKISLCAVAVCARQVDTRPTSSHHTTHAAPPLRNPTYPGCKPSVHVYIWRIIV